MDAWLDEAENRGISKGISQGEQKMGQLVGILLRDGRNQDALEAATNETRRAELYRQYNIN